MVKYYWECELDIQYYEKEIKVLMKKIYIKTESYMYYEDLKLQKCQIYFSQNKITEA